MRWLLNSCVEIRAIIFHPIDSYLALVHVWENYQLFGLKQQLVSCEVGHPPAVEAIDGVVVLYSLSIFQV